MGNAGTSLLTLRISTTLKRYWLTCAWKAHIVAQGLSLDAFADLIMADAFDSGTPWATEVRSSALAIVAKLESSGPIDEGKPLAVCAAAACECVYFDCVYLCAYVCLQLQ